MPESCAIKPGHGGLSAAAAWRCTDINPLSFTAVRNPERMLAMVLALIPTMIGFTPESLPLITGRSSMMLAGSWPRISATRSTAERKSRIRVAGTEVSLFNTLRRSARVAAGGLVVMVARAEPFVLLRMIGVLSGSC